MKKTFANIQIPGEMMKIVSGRITEMVKHPAIQAELVKKHNAGMTSEECRQWVTDMAIATLYGATA